MYIIHKFRDLIDNIRFMQRDMAVLGVDYFLVKYRFWREGLKQSSRPQYLRGMAFILVGVAVIAVAVNFLYSQSWSGLVTLESPTANSYSVKTLWDWMELLIIPLVLAVIAYVFRQSEVKVTNQQSRERSRDDALNLYLQHIQTILLETDLSDVQAAGDARKLITARTASLLRTLDPERKLFVLRFLYDLELIQEDQPIVNLDGADLSCITSYNLYLCRANLHGANLKHAQLASAQLDGADLSGASLGSIHLMLSHLNGANLDYAILDEADLYFAHLQSATLIKAIARKANFACAYLDGTDLRSADLTRASLRKAKLRGASLWWVTLVHANLANADFTGANLTEANLMYVNLSGADLTEANLTNAVVSRSQLRKAKSISGAVLDGIRDRLGPPQIASPEEIRHRYCQDEKNLNESDAHPETSEE